MAIEDLKTLLSTLAPSLDDKAYVFCTFPDASKLPDSDHYHPLATMIEEEGITWILEQAAADTLGLHYEQAFSRITLKVHSSLTAVGLTAAVSTALAQQGISANVIAAYYHDHIFVPDTDANTALGVLEHLATEQ